MKNKCEVRSAEKDGSAEFGIRSAAEGKKNGWAKK